MKTFTLLLLIAMLLIPCSDTADRVINEKLGKLTKGKVPGHKVLPILKIVLSLVMLVFMKYSVLTNICLVLVIVQSGYLLKKY